MTLYAEICKAAKARPTTERKGQALMNALHSIRPALFAAWTDTMLDCFYDDRNIPAFKAAIKELDSDCQT